MSKFRKPAAVVGLMAAVLGAAMSSTARAGGATGPDPKEVQALVDKATAFFKTTQKPDLSQKTDSTVGANIAKEDSARAETAVPFSADAVFEFITDIERLLRLNPHLEIDTWQRMPDGMRLAALNETTGRRIETAVRVETASATRTIVLTYADGLKQATTLTVEDGDGHGCRLVVTEHYPVIEDAQDPRVAEVDRSLIPWVNAIRRHLLGRKRWGRLPGWRWWHEEFLPGMAPRQRRIVRMIVWVSVLEFVVFLLVAVIFWAEQRGG